VDARAARQAAPAPREHGGPTLFVPAHPESAPPESDPAPLIVPGNSPGVDSLERARVAKALEQYSFGRTLEAANPGSALLMYRNALRLDPDLPDVRYRMGLIQVRRNEISDALDSFAGEVTRNPGHRDAARQLGLTLARGGQPDHAIAQLQRLVTEKPDDGESWHALGYAYITAKRPREAETALRRAIALPPENSEEHRDLALVLENLGKVDEARAEYRRSLALAPNDPSAWFNFGNLERRAGRADSAIAAYRRAEGADSTFRWAWQAEIQVHHDLAHADSELAAYERWLEAQPNEHGARVEAVELASRLGRREDALALAREGVNRLPKNGESHEILGVTLAGQGQVRAGVESLRKAQTLYGRDPNRYAEIERALVRIRAVAPDSLRGFLAADSVAHPSSIKSMPPPRKRVDNR
jgi:tetratricopeptide (TPR) repeat protein